MKVYKGTIVTCDKNGTVASYLVEEKGRIAFVGDTLPERYAGLPMEDLSDRALLPAFCDTHIHFSSYATFAATIDIKDVTSNDEMVQLLREYDQKKRPKLILAFGASAHSVAEKRVIDRRQLDKAFPDKPVLIVKYDGHSCVCNTAMLKMLPQGVQAMRGFDGETGLLDKEAFYGATNFVAAKVSPLQLIKNQIAAFDRLADYGVGMIHAVEGVGFPLDMDVDLARLVARGLKNRFNVRLFFQTMDVGKVQKRRLPRIGGCFLTALDGCFGTVDAAVLEPYTNGSNGVLYYTDEQVLDFVRKAHGAGLQIAVHCIGDAAVEQAVCAFEIAQRENPRKDARHIIIHADLMNDSQRQRLIELGISIARQPCFTEWNLEPYEYYQTILGERADQLAPYRRELEMGLRIAAGSDAPVTNPDPIEGIHRLINQRNPQDNITVWEALRMYTWEGAYLSFDETQRGSLEPGKIADMTVLSANPLTIPAELFRELRAERLILAGRDYVKGQSVLSMLLGALHGRNRIGRAV